MTDGHANFPTHPTREEPSVSDCFIRQLRVWYSIHRVGVLQPEDRHVLILVGRQGRGLTTSVLIWFGLETVQKRLDVPACSSPCFALNARSVAMTTNLEAVV